MHLFYHSASSVSLWGCSAVDAKPFFQFGSLVHWHDDFCGD